jgi:hypothetical protein
VSALLKALAANPMAAAVGIGATSSLADAGRRGTGALLGVLADLAGAARRCRAARRNLTQRAASRPWREPGYGLARALAEEDFAAGRARLTAALTCTEMGEQ